MKLKMTGSILVLIIVFTVTALLVSNEKSQSKPVNTPLSLEKYIKPLNGIEYLYVKMVEKNQNNVLERVALVMQYNKQPLPKPIEKKLAALKQSSTNQNAESISLIDKKNGYMVTSCTFCSGSTHMVYWNQSNKTKTIGIVSSDCGPICEYNLSFYTYKNGHISATVKNKITPVINKSDFLLNKNKAEIFQQDPYEIAYILPRSGKNILVTLADADKSNFKGNCLNLLWKDGYFEKGPIKFCKL